MFCCFKTKKAEKIEDIAWKPHPKEGHDNPTFSQDDINLSQMT
ncbi:hypothetical protein GDO81_010489 [Engystomops pustulosus]|uniref:Uncharacterized protein n=2 Tax=Engystomops pustulosus TaxID=76066 RepID=A0AAV7C0F0_ENGPU|nr:hypothetical protein GDO81_010489 [Engystomops pustulosus]